MLRGKLKIVIGLILVYLTIGADVTAAPATGVEREDREVTDPVMNYGKYSMDSEDSRYRAMAVVGKSQERNIKALTERVMNYSHMGKETGTSDFPFGFHELLYETESDNDTECVLNPCAECIGKFKQEVYNSKASFVYLHLEVEEPDVKITGSDRIVGENIWVWTFWGEEGGLEILNWPAEFGIWSSGLLTSFVIKKPIIMKLDRVSGNCSNLKVGVLQNDKIISNALVSLGNSFRNQNKYGPSFYCYKTRKFIQPAFAYILCKHIVCPVETLRYNCCSNSFNRKANKREITCGKITFEYEFFSWILPIVGSVILFAFFPLLLLYLAHSAADGKHVHRQSNRNYLDIDADDDVTRNNIVLLNDHHPVTLSKTLLIPIRLCCSKLMANASGPCRCILRRICRLFVPFLSLTFIGLQISLDYFYLYDFVRTSVSKGVPMGFRSIIAGYDESKANFLPYLGGPFVAVGIYLLITCFMLLVPTSVSDLLLAGVSENSVDETSPLMLKLSSLELYGSRTIRHTHGFYKLYSVFTAQIFMLINARFWRHALSVQTQRWERICICKCMLIVLPVYLIICVLELILCITFNGLPLISFGFLIVKSYCRQLYSYQARRRFLFRPLVFILTVTLIAFVLYFLFMFSTIFMDAILFLCRVAMFTFTGVVIYPKVPYGYIFFVFTVIYYIWQSCQDFALIYDRLLRDTLVIAKSLQSANDTHRLVVKIGDFKGVSGVLFEHVIERHCPRREQVFVSLLKVTAILTIMGLLLFTVSETDSFRNLHEVMHVGTVLFVCALPQIMRSMCRGSGYKGRHKRFQRELEESITSFMSNSHKELSSDTSL